MILIAESGATKISWALIDPDTDQVRECRTRGINVAVMDETSMAAILDEACAALFPSEPVADYSCSPLECACTPAAVQQIHFYAAGLVAERPEPELEAMLHRHFPSARIEFNSDMVAAARALWGDEPGIVSILGTGSNTCFYDGRQVHFNVRSGGFILGDEGSGAVFARNFIADLFKNLVPPEVAEPFKQEFDARYETIVHNIYRGEAPSRYLAHFVPFILEYRDHPYVSRLIRSNFIAYLERAVLTYDVAHYAVGVVGTFGWMLEPVLKAIGLEHGVRFTGFVKNPIDRLIPYHKAHHVQE